MNRSLNGLLYSRKFWLAVFGVAQSLLFYFVPDFPDAIWISIDALVAVLIATIAAEDVAKIRDGRHISQQG